LKFSMAIHLKNELADRVLGRSRIFVSHPGSVRSNLRAPAHSKYRFDPENAFTFYLHDERRAQISTVR
jgi:hypothetical protein